MNTGNDPPADGALNDAAPPPKTAPTILVSAAPTEQPGDRIGRYKLLQVIGEGGCGAVYMAEQQEPVRRRVALKVIKLGMDTRQVIARFEAERQALALMDHPNIAKVLDAGATENGRPYFVMELVRGIKITEYCDQNHLDTGQRLGLFVQVCQAIQHAHQKGIIHRDIKPSNILVTLHDGVPVPKVIDFGIAKATTNQPLTDKTLFTAYEQFIGTPAYMSPEQAEMSGLDIDTRSDVYSLGVLLYELLTGCTPFDPRELMKSGLDAMRKTIREQEPPRPSTKLDTLQGEDSTTTARAHGTDMPKLITLLQGDLDWIVMKCLEKDRTRRYEAVNGLAMDVQRHVNNEPVLARPPSKLYRFQKLVQRNKPAFVAAAAVVLSLCIGLGVSTWLFLREREAHRLAVAAIHLREERDRLQENRKKLTEAVAIKARESGSELKYGDEIERLIGGIPISEIPDEHLFGFVSYLGVWHATHGRWKQANDYFAAVLGESHRPTLAPFPFFPAAFAAVYIRHAATLLHLGDVRAYNELRQRAVSHYAGTTDAGVAETVVKLALLRPADPKVLSALKPVSELVAKSIAEAKGTEYEDAFAWHQATMGLWEYRSGNYGAVEHWCQESLAHPPKDQNLARIANLQLLLAMAHLQLGNTNLAQSELAQAGEIIRTGFDDGVRNISSWHDWLIDRFLMGEAQGLIPRPAPGDIVEIKPSDAEVRLRQREENRKKLTEAATLLARGDPEKKHGEEIERLIGGIPISEIPDEYLPLIPYLSGWHATHGRWKQASDYLAIALRESHRPGLAAPGAQAGLSPLYLASAVSLLQLGDVGAYDELRQMAISNYAGSTSLRVAQAIPRMALLRPAGEKILSALRPMYEMTAKSLGEAKGTRPEDDVAWQQATMGCWEYRSGNYGAVERWCRESLAHTPKDTNPARFANLQLLLAMAHFQLGNTNLAQSELAQARGTMRSGFDDARRTASNWADWVIDRLLLREAEELIPRQVESPEKAK